MIDNHYYPNNWGIKPVLFNVGGLDIPAYSFFTALGLLAGLILYFYETKRKQASSGNGIFIVIGSLVGGVLGAKLLEFAINYKFVIQNFSKINIFFSGKTIIGGLIGGTAGVIITKKILGIKEKRGNFFAPAIAISVAIGRIGCFFRGCCYGKATSLPWGVNFGDGILRQPTQIYEALFMLAMFMYLQKVKDNKEIQPGQMFKILMIVYFIFRFLIEFIRVERVAFAGFTYFQYISIVAILYLSRSRIKRIVGGKNV